MKRYSKHGLRMRALRQAGWDAFHAGRKIHPFDGKGERERAVWEIGWRAAKEGHPKPFICPSCNGIGTVQLTSEFWTETKTCPTCNDK